MSSDWQILANSSRWRGIVEFIRNWVGPFDCDAGMSESTLDASLNAVGLSLPSAMREWYLLAGNLQQVGLNVWIHPDSLAVHDGVIEVLTDPYGITSWRVSCRRLHVDDPPVDSDDEIDEGAFSCFTDFVAAMTVNDAIFGDPMVDDTVELNPRDARRTLARLVASRVGDFYADAPLESASVVMFDYLGDGPTVGKARNATGRQLLDRLRIVERE